MLTKLSEPLNLPNIIMPGELLIQKALSRINSKIPNFFSKIKEVRVSPGMGGYAYVTNKPEDTGIIFLDFNRIKSEMESKMSGSPQEQTEEAVIRALYEAVGHEEGHISNEMEGGELPAEQRASEVVRLVESCNTFLKLVKKCFEE